MLVAWRRLSSSAVFPHLHKLLEKIGYGGNDVRFWINLLVSTFCHSWIGHDLIICVMCTKMYVYLDFKPARQKVCIDIRRNFRSLGKRYVEAYFTVNIIFTHLRKRRCNLRHHLREISGVALNRALFIGCTLAIYAYKYIYCLFKINKLTSPSTELTLHKLSFPMTLKL